MGCLDWQVMQIYVTGSQREADAMDLYLIVMHMEGMRSCTLRKEKLIWEFLVGDGTIFIIVMILFF